MVAVRIQNFASAPHGLPSPADRIMASSQGAFMKATDASLIGITPEKHDPVNRLLVVDTPIGCQHSLAIASLPALELSKREPSTPARQYLGRKDLGCWRCH